MSMGCIFAYCSLHFSTIFPGFDQTRPPALAANSAISRPQKKETRYCYSDEERISAIEALGPKPEITRFKGLGEISPQEFQHFIGAHIR